MTSRKMVVVNGVGLGGICGTNDGMFLIRVFGPSALLSRNVWSLLERSSSRKNEQAKAMNTRPREPTHTIRYWRATIYNPKNQQT
jgi:hypothetical protein